MPIRLVCPSCSAAVSVKDEYAGRTVKCPKCGAAIPAPQPGAALPPSKPAASLPTPEPEPPPFEAPDEPAKPKGKPAARPTAKVVPEERSDDDDRPARSKKRRDAEDDQNEPVKGKKSGSNLLLILCVVGGFLLMCSGVVGYGIYYYVTKVTTQTIEEAKKSKAQLGCKSLETAIEAYQMSDRNPGQTDEERMPQDISNLYNPPFGGPSFLKDGQAATIDPWGKSYQFEARTRSDGTIHILVHTTAPDGTPISQFGIGPNSLPKN